MSLGLAAVLIALGASLLYKGYKGWTWQQFYQSIFKKG